MGQTEHPNIEYREFNRPMKCDKNAEYKPEHDVNKRIPPTMQKMLHNCPVLTVGRESSTKNEYNEVIDK